MIIKYADNKYRLPIKYQMGGGEYQMNQARAKEIVSSPVMVEVTCEGADVYLERVNEKSETCTVHYLNQPERKTDVPLSQLVEH